MNLREEALNLIAEVLELDAAELAPETEIRDVPNWDSLTQLQIIGQLEDTFQIIIPIEKIITIKTVNDLLSFLK